MQEKTRNDILIASHRNTHLCELPRALWWDADGNPHYSIPAPTEKPTPAWMSVITAIVFLVASLLSVVIIAEQGL